MILTENNMTNHLANMTLPVPGGSLEAYIAQVNAVPMLSKETEYDLATRWQENSDTTAAKQLVTSHLKFVVKVARQYLGYGLPLGDLIQEGNVGLMKGVKRFKPEVGVRLVSFAVHWIKSEIHEYVIANWRIVKVATTKAQRKLFFNLRKMKRRLGWMTSSEVEDIAEELGVKTNEVMEMESRLNAMDSGFDEPAISKDGVEFSGFSEVLPAPEESPEHQVVGDSATSLTSDGLYKALEHLKPREVEIIQSRWLDTEQGKKTTLKDLAQKFNISTERVRQLEKQAFAKMKESLAKVLA